MMTPKIEIPISDDIFATRSDWLVKMAGVIEGRILVIHPRDELTYQMVVDALKKQGLWQQAGGYSVVPHGNKIMIQRRKFKGSIHGE